MRTLSGEREYNEKTPTSRALYQRALKVFPGGITHDSRLMRPHPISIVRARGARKWDVDGNEYVDYFGGHGALILGHAHPAVVEAVGEQSARGTQYGASHELELEWAELIVEMVPSAEKVRFTSSGTEASMLGIRLARAFSGKDKIVRFVTNFHGWHDQVAFASVSHFDGSIPAGIPAGTVENIILCPPNDIEQLTRICNERDDIAAVMIEPTGSGFGHVPTGGEFLAQVRKLTRKRDILLIFDEVITGFRVAPGGAQEYYGVTPDLTLLAKIVAGGYPGGALVGRADILDVLEVKSDPRWNHEHRVSHHGTFNANPLAASAGLTALKLVASTDVTGRANRSGRTLRNALNEVVRDEGMNWIVYGEFSDFHVFTNQEDENISLKDIYAGRVHYTKLKEGTPAHLAFGIRAGFIVRGVDIAGWPGGMVSAVHCESDIEHTARAFKAMLAQFKEEGLVA